MPTRHFSIRFATVLTACAGLATGAMAQDSVSNATNVGGDALSAYATQTTRYIVDLRQFQSQWGSQFAIGPILKATRDSDVMFNTLALGSSTFSPEHRLNVSIGAPANYSVWSTRGSGIAPENAAAGTVAASTFGRYFGLATSDLNADATNVIGALVGVQNDNITRLYVRRTNAAHSRITAGTEDTGTVSLGSIDASGYVGVRADGFNGTGSNRIAGENIARINLTSRSAGLNGIFKSGSNNVWFDAPASSFLINNGTVTTNPPAVLPATIAGAPTSLLLNFANTFAVNSGAGVLTHLDPSIDSHRGNPAFYETTTLGGVGIVASLGRSAAGGGACDAINLAIVNSAGSVVGTRGAALPSPIPGFASLNASGDAQFLQYLSQVGFRGPNGLVGVGRNVLNGNALAAATATDPTAGDFIAVASFPAGGGSATWTVAAYEGQQVKNGPAGAVVGVIGTGSPISISAPAIDTLGNVYFVGVFDPTVGAPVNALFKAVNTVSGYALEIILKEGDVFTGANSNTPYTVEALFLGDADSLASSGFHGGQVLQPQIPQYTTTDPASPFAASGILVNARIAYNNLGTAEAYEAVLFIGPWAAPTPLCAGDINGDGFTNAGDFTILAGNFGTSVTPGTNGDLNGDGLVNASDFTILAGDFGCGN